MSLHMDVMETTSNLTRGIDDESASKRRKVCSRASNAQRYLRFHEDMYGFHCDARHGELEDIKSGRVCDQNHYTYVCTLVYDVVSHRHRPQSEWLHFVFGHTTVRQLIIGQRYHISRDHPSRNWLCDASVSEVTNATVTLMLSRAVTEDESLTELRVDKMLRCTHTFSNVVAALSKVVPRAEDDQIFPIVRMIVDPELDEEDMMILNEHPDDIEFGVCPDLNDRQREAFCHCSTHRITLISGGPGTGKTYLAKCVERALAVLCDPMVIYSNAPTLKLAVVASFDVPVHKVVQCTNASLDLSVTWADVVLMDDAAQSLEAMSIVPVSVLKSDGRLILVGDHRQLPSYSDCKFATNAGLLISLFERLSMRCGLEPVVLVEQYRMQSNICWFPNLCFYGEELCCHSSTKELRICGTFPWNPRYPGIAFIRSVGREKALHTSYVNAQEALEIICLLECHFCETVSAVGMEGGRRIAILTFYVAQANHIRNLLEKRGFGRSNIVVSTVDAFQGSESSVVILSTVRSTDSQGGIGYCMDPRRINVALTRAKEALLIVGDATALVSGDTFGNWRTLLRTWPQFQWSTCYAKYEEYSTWNDLGLGCHVLSTRESALLELFTANLVYEGEYDGMPVVWGSTAHLMRNEYDSALFQYDKAHANDPANVEDLQHTRMCELGMTTVW